MRTITLIQGLRAAAALAIAWHHILNDGIKLGISVPDWPGVSWDIGIDVFFVISGFVMVYSSQTMFAQPGATRWFLLRRVNRIVPLYWGMTTLFLLATQSGAELVHTTLGGPAYILASYAFIPYTRPDGLINPAYSLGWTLNFEMFFYLWFGLSLRFPRFGAVGFTAGVLMAGVVARQLGFVPGSAPLLVWTDPIITEFVFGMGIGCLALEAPPLGPALRAGLALGALALYFVLGFWMPDLLRPIRCGIPAAMAVAAAALGPEPSLTRSMRWVLLTLGDASYALYLVHPFPMRALEITWNRLHLTGVTAAVTYMVAALIASVVAAVMVHWWIEKPVTRALNRWTGTRHNAPVYSRRAVVEIKS